MKFNRVCAYSVLSNLGLCLFCGFDSQKTLSFTFLWKGGGFYSLGVIDY